MSFSSHDNEIKSGDTVIVYLNVNQMYAIVVDPEKTFQTKYGALQLATLLGREFGTAFQVGLKGGYAYVLRPTPELWTLTLPHRTQVIYTPDISLIIMMLDLKPGSVVCESGTGSGSLTHALIRSVMPRGHVHTFDFHEQRVQIASEEFRDHGLGPFVTVKHRDVIENGFDTDSIADAVILDLPMPWKVLPSLRNTFKLSGGRVCSFSPCIEQVQRTCDTLRQSGYVDVDTYECLQRSLEVRKIDLKGISDTANKTVEAGVAERTTKSYAVTVPPATMPGHTGYLTFATLLPCATSKSQVTPMDSNQVE